ncbi:MAG TPA: NAD(P)-dependent oxidoreductase [Kiritimatiellia bacterium]|nr:NAD(P)-dependent oxidoreductase [Kiritimatiellia bacterium]HPS07006.1 NAD(P)-dependent oxidoreductase [Kiritimatiellia bacterium]
MRLHPHDFIALNSRETLFAQLRDKHIFLTGGTGFFGKWLLESFLRVNKIFELNAQVTVLSRHPNEFLAQNPWLAAESSVTFLPGDIRDFTFPKSHFDFVIHAATEASAKLERENPKEMYAVIVDGTRRVLEFAANAGVSRLMLTSSGAVYGDQPTDVSHIGEDYPGCPASAYGKGKLAAEKMCADAGAQYGFVTLLPRCFAFVGPYLNLDIHFAVGNFIRDCLENRPIVIRGDGTPLRSYLYAADLAEWLWTILLKGEHARPYNVGSDEAISIRDLALKVRACAGTDNPITIQEKPNPALPPPRYVPSIQRAKTELRVEIRCPLDEAIRRTLAWHRTGTATFE